MFNCLFLVSFQKVENSDVEDVEQDWLEQEQRWAAAQSLGGGKILTDAIFISLFIM
jgi:hypothetical protein